MPLGFILVALFLGFAVISAIACRWMLHTTYVVPIVSVLLALVFGGLHYFTEANNEYYYIPSWLVKKEIYHNASKQPIIKLTVRGVSAEGWLSPEETTKFFQLPSQFRYYFYREVGYYRGQPQAVSIKSGLTEITEDDFIRQSMEHHAQQKRLEKFQKELNTIKEVKLTMLEGEPKSPKLLEKFTFM